MAESAAPASPMEAGENNFATAPGSTVPVEQKKVLSEATIETLKRKLHDAKREKNDDQTKEAPVEPKEKRSKLVEKEIQISSDSDDSSPTMSVSSCSEKEEPFAEPPKAIEVFNGLGVLGAELKNRASQWSALTLRDARTNPSAKRCG